MDGRYICAYARYYAVFMMAITTGMRQGEILGLQWRDVDLDARTISVKQILNHDGKELEPGTKTKNKGLRMIGIDPVTVSELEKLKRRTNRERMAAGGMYEDNGLVMCTSLGSPVSPRNINRSFSRLVEKINKLLFNRDIPSDTEGPVP
ncbi:tyrosine-type recombinase/integrase [Paenibacillus sp. D51F]